MSEVEWLEIFSDNLRGMLQEQGVSQRELADMTGLSEGSISNYANGVKMPGVRAIVNISHALDCDIDDLMDFDEMIN